jgi:hypothetical protein
MKDKIGQNNIQKGEDDEDVYIVSVDSRGRSASDLEAYKEYTCPRSFFNKHLADEPKSLCVTSEIAELCGMKLKVFFFESDHQHENRQPSMEEDLHHEINVAGALFTFDPETGHTRYKIQGQAFIIWEDGTKPLSKRQVWGMHELIKEGRALYYSVKTHDPNDYTHLRKAKLEIIGWCAQYEAGTWSPHAIYEPRHLDHHRQHHANHHHQHHSNKEKRFSLKRELERGLSGVSDQATYHHGEEFEGHTAHTPHHQNLTHHKSTDKNHAKSPIRQDFEHRGPFQEDQPRAGNHRNPFQSMLSACGAAYEKRE